MRRRTLLRLGVKRMQDVQCPAPADATEVEVMACEAPTPAPKPEKPKDGTVKPLGGGGGIGNPPEPKK